MNDFEDNEHALLTGIVVGSLRERGVEADVMVNDVDDATPYIRLKFEHEVQAVVVVLPSS